MSAANESILHAIDRDGFAILPAIFDADVCQQLIRALEIALAECLNDKMVLRRANGAIYGARNLLAFFPHAASLWRKPLVVDLLTTVLGPECGLVRGLFFDKPPDSTWSLPWHGSDDRGRRSFSSKPTISPSHGKGGLASRRSAGRRASANAYAANSPRRCQLGERCSASTSRHAHRARRRANAPGCHDSGRGWRRAGDAAALVARQRCFKTPFAAASPGPSSRIRGHTGLTRRVPVAAIPLLVISFEPPTFTRLEEAVTLFGAPTSFRRFLT
jgi:hypothetical protein